MAVPILNTIRFYNASESPEYSTYFPDINRIAANDSLNYGIKSVNWHKSWPVGEEIKFQVINILSAKVIKSDGTQINITPEEITPSGWTTTERYYTVSYTPTLGEKFYFRITVSYNVYPYLMNKAYHSDNIYANTKFKYNLNKIEFKNSTNRYDNIFNNAAGTNIYSGITYFEGLFEPDKPSNEITTYKTQEEKPIKTKASPQFNRVLTFTDIPYHYYEQLNMIFSCNDIKVNGIQVDNNENEPDPDRINNESNLTNIKIQLQVVTDNYTV